ncbi:MAG: hypothetical protein UR51_C0010G0026 [Candidatus Moranbacteria bacterium GW2011_GWF1_34_10]|nr:MAG: hypothetical protein UR51_C0010G0026 [Candidatus Moranbacteria bacterium GW2011_GWF1_34_10]
MFSEKYATIDNELKTDPGLGGQFVFIGKVF